ncbi:CD2 antigen cytoplasmic tail-binding protein 2 homolog [Orussus abietinus]|uniref:CD2 antigen cytoplasmic tail-binding protein 2 homolog n=1 Tax=Orussus abietinus TaxID=222816 RepID=UPI0006254C61|nr:CD2 antigen cytoplasmic tail-binding protein 2 homolog [Orussus abietinus]XP_012270593.1 CD2 antigen cytoplasmic tail-binding protein 2 homolog [Orussus abietinus]
MSKRKFNEISTADWPVEQKPALKNSLDSDEDDDEVTEDTYNVMNEDEFEGVEDGPVTQESEVGFTAFNMKEELEEGHFDKDGHYLWNKEKEIRDNWLDNIDWVQIKERKKTKTVDESKGLADSDSEEEEKDIVFDPTPLYKQILEYLKPGETVSQALCRLGKGKKKMSSADRWKKKKEVVTSAEEDEKSAQIIKLTELANELLTRTGNMDIYQENFELIKKKIQQSEKQSHPSKQEAELDMYADDFDVKEKAKLGETDNSSKTTETEEMNTEKTGDVDSEVTWQLKWSQQEEAEVLGPYSSKQMQLWAKKGYFKTGAWVRRTGQEGQFYSAGRVDFDLYL